jgi:hypothetical protein
MRCLPVSLLMLLATFAASAQLESRSHPDADHPINTIFRAPAVNDSGCPVGLFVERQSETRMFRAGDSYQRDPGQGLHMTFSRRDGPQIESVDVTVYGETSTLHALPAAMRSPGEVSKTFHLQRSKEVAGLEDASVSMQKVGSLTRLELTSITYADGTTWNESKSSHCQAVPSLLLPIGGQ